MLKFSALTSNAQDLQRRVEQIRLDSLKPIQGAEPDFKQRLKEATQRVAARHQPSRIEANATTSNESFGSKIKRAIAERLPRAQTRQQHAEQSERARNRYPGYGGIKRRQRTKGE